MRLKGQIALVTGATSGLGESIAKRFAHEGAQVIVVGRNEERGASVAAAIKEAGGEAIFIQAELTREEDVKNMVQKAVAHFGSIDIVINNAGLVIPGNVADLSLEQWDKVFQTNVTSTFLVSHYALPVLIEKKSGSIINISSEAGLKGLQNRAAYCAAKAAVVGLTKAMAVDHSPQGVRVNCICPGTIETPMVRNLIDSSVNPEDTMKQFLQRRLTPYLGTPEQIAEAAVYFALPDNLYVTGAILSIDGGALVK